MVKGLDEARAVRTQSGTSVVEMTLVLPLLLLLLFAIGDFGIAYTPSQSTRGSFLFAKTIVLEAIS